MLPASISINICLRFDNRARNAPIVGTGITAQIRGGRENARLLPEALSAAEVFSPALMYHHKLQCYSFTA